MSGSEREGGAGDGQFARHRPRHRHPAGEAGANVTINYLRNRSKAEETGAAIEAVGSEALIVRGNVRKRRMWPKCSTPSAPASAGWTFWSPTPHRASKIGAGAQPALLALDDGHQRRLPFAVGAGGGAIDGRERRHNPGRLVIGAVRAIPHYAAVGASKAALESLVRHLAQNWLRATFA